MFRVLASVDGSENSLRAVRYIAEQRDRYRDPLELHILNVQPPVISGAVKMFISGEQLDQYYREEAAKSLQAARRLLDDLGVPYQHHVIVGEIAPTIARFAKEKQCHQIVLGTRGLSGFSGAILGSVASKVIHLAEAPVLLIK